MCSRKLHWLDVVMMVIETITAILMLIAISATLFAERLFLEKQWPHSKYHWLVLAISAVVMVKLLFPWHLLPFRRSKMSDEDRQKYYRIM